MKFLYMAKVLSRETGETHWFFVSATGPTELHALCEDSESKLVEWECGEEAIKRRLATEFDNLALVSDV